MDYGYLLLLVLFGRILYLPYCGHVRNCRRMFACCFAISAIFMVLGWYCHSLMIAARIISVILLVALFVVMRRVVMKSRGASVQRPPCEELDFSSMQEGE